MNKWIEEKGGGEIDQILEGHGTQFVVRFVSYAKPQYWWIKESPFLLDVHKKFATLGEAKEYCERRYKELFGTIDEITRLRVELASEEQRIDLMRKDSIDLRKTLTELRADLAAVTAERNGMKEALKAGLRFVGASDDAMEELHAENERLREALKPFVELGLKEARKEGLWGPKAIVTINQEGRMSDDMLDQRTRQRLEDLQDIVEQESKLILQKMKETLATIRPNKEPDEHLNLRNAECLPSTVAVIKPEPPR
jgi:hypothetical protein